MFLLTFAGVLPGLVLLVPRQLDRVAHRHGGEAADRVALVLAIALCVLLVCVKTAERLVPTPRPTMLFVASAVWLLLAIGTFVIALRAAAPPICSGRLDNRVLWVVLAGLLWGVILLFAALGSVSAVPLAAGLLVASAVGYWAPQASPAPAPSRVRLGADLAALALLALAVPNLVVFRPEDPSAGVETTIIQFHQNFYLGPANAVVGGGAMLVDVFSQYGVGSIAFLAGVFALVPIGNGTLALTEGVLAAGMFCCAYLTLRLARVGLALAWSAMAVALVVLVFNLDYPVGALLQHGAFRFGLPMVILVAAVAEARVDNRARLLRGVQVATVAIASVWSFEALLYSLGALAGVAAFRIATTSRPRREMAVRILVQVLLACAAVHAAFALVTLAAAGELPDWGSYVTTLREFLTGSVGELTYDFAPWSPGIAVGALYATSAVALALVVAREPNLVARERPALMALSAGTGYGIALFSYFVNRSSDHILPYVSLPAVIIVTIWLAILLRDGRLSPAGSRLATASVLAGAAILVAVAWSDAGTRLSQSALAHALPGGSSLRGAVDRLWEGPTLGYGAEDAVRMLEEYLPGEEESVVLTSADLSVEALIETDRVNAIPLSDPWEDSLVPDLHREAVKEAVSELEPGRLIVIDAASREVLADRAEGEPTLVPTGIALLQAEALRQITRRFRLKPVARAPSGVEVVELRPR